MKSVLVCLLSLHGVIALGAPVEPEAVRQAMARATRYMMSISTHGGYLYKYSADLTLRFGEQAASPLQIWVQPPGTGSMGQAFLKAYAATRDPLYLEAARNAATSLAEIQLASGGWHYSGDFDPKRPNRDGQLSYQGEQAAEGKHSDNPHYRMATTYDDRTTQNAIQFLMAFLEAAKGASQPADTAIQASLERALDGMLRAQYPNGAWPQRYAGTPRQESDYPIIKASFPAKYPPVWPGIDYTAFYTLNDNCQRDCLQVLVEAYHRYGNPKYLEAARIGADFILLAQLPDPQPAWAQQYDFQMQPAWARVMEPPGISSAESCGALSALLDFYLETGEAKYLEAVARTAEWLRKSALESGKWARLYELKTNKPIYGSKDGKIHYKLSEARPGYNWQDSYHIPQVLATYEEIKKAGRDAYLQAHSKNGSSTPKAPAQLQKEVTRVLSNLDAQGRWIATTPGRKFAKPQPMISTADYIANMGLLGRYLESLAQKTP